MTHGKFSINANLISLLFKIVIITTSDSPPRLDCSPPTRGHCWQRDWEIEEYSKGVL